MKKFTRYIAFAFFMLVLLLPALQQKFELFKVRDLNGAFILADKPPFSWNSWFTGDFQENFEKYLEDHIGFRDIFVRVKNQMDFSLYKKTNAEGVVVGKKDYLYEYDYIRDYIGEDFVGMEFIRKKMLKAKFIQQYLKESLNIDFVIIFEPGKASYYPEYIPDEFFKEPIGQTNYQAYKSLCDELGIRYIDMDSYFLQLKSSEPYPLIPKYGTHWSLYSVPYVMDTLVSWIEKERNISMRGISVENNEVVTSPRASDNDMELPLNLMFPLPAQTYAYPEYQIDSSGTRTRPMVLTISDSYYWMIFNSRLPRQLFNNEAFWYYNNKVYPDSYFTPTLVKELNFREEVEKQNVIFLMVTGRFLHKFDWRFIDMVYKLYAPTWIQDPVYDRINRIVLLDEWFDQVMENAKLANVTLEDQLNDEGKFLYMKEDWVSYMIDFGVDYYSDLIEGDTAWYATIVTKAKENGVSEQEQLRLDADYMFYSTERNLYDIHKGSENIAMAMEEDLDGLDSLQAEAIRYGSPLKDYIWQKARMLYREQEIKKNELAIRSTPHWLKDVSKKAAEQGKTLDSMIHEDAVWIWEQRLKK